MEDFVHSSYSSGVVFALRAADADAALGAGGVRT